MWTFLSPDHHIYNVNSGEAVKDFLEKNLAEEPCGTSHKHSFIVIVILESHGVELPIINIPSVDHDVFYFP